MEFRYSRECLDVPDPHGFLLDSGRLVSSDVPGDRSCRDLLVTWAPQAFLHDFVKLLLDSGRLVSSGVPGGRSSRDPVVTSVSSSVLHVL